MISYIKLLENGSIISEEYVGNNYLEDIALPKCIHSWKKYGFQYSFYAEQSPDSGERINKHDLPPPIDTQLLYGPVIVIS